MVPAVIMIVGILLKYMVLLPKKLQKSTKTIFTFFVYMV